MLIKTPSRREFLTYAGIGVGAAAFLTRNSKGQILSSQGITPAKGIRAAGAPGVASGWTLLSHAAASSSTNGQVTVAGVNGVGGNLIVAALAEVFGNSNVALTDSSSNTYTRLNSYFGSVGGFYITLFYCYAPTVTGSMSFSNETGAGHFPSLAVAVFSGSASSPFDQQNGNNVSGSASTITLNAITPGQNGELIVSALGTGGAASLSSVGSGFTLTDFLPDISTAAGVGLAYLVQATATAIGPTWTLSASVPITASIASFK